MEEMQRRALERGVSIYHQLEEIKNDPEWIRFCEMMALWECRTDAVDPSSLEEFEQATSERKAEERRVLEQTKG